MHGATHIKIKISPSSLKLFSPDTEITSCHCVAKIWQDILHSLANKCPINSVSVTNIHSSRR
jgi:hypothetical protein